MARFKHHCACTNGQSEPVAHRRPTSAASGSKITLKRFSDCSQLGPKGIQATKGLKTRNPIGAALGQVAHGTCPQLSFATPPVG